MKKVKRKSLENAGEPVNTEYNSDEPLATATAPPTESVGGTTATIGGRSFCDWEDLGEFDGDDEFKVEPVLSRTSMLLLDYRQFKAARTIQKNARGWFVRHMLAKKHAAAIVIQTEWRRFYSGRYFYRHLEQLLQERIMESYHRAATKIQSLYRGYWVRENVHDHYRMARMQVRAAEDLLQCVAFKLHHLLRTHQIPGIYSLRNSKYVFILGTKHSLVCEYIEFVLPFVTPIRRRGSCLSKVEQLLAAMSFKQHNDRVRLARAKRDAEINEAKKKFCDSAYSTHIPYAGPNILGYCEPKCCALFAEKDADKKMFKILSMYDRVSRIDPRIRKINAQPKSTKRSTRLSKAPLKPSDFCGDVVASMRKWNILANNKHTIDPDIVHNPENVEKFLTEVQSLYSLMKERCHCTIDVLKRDMCR